MAGLIAAGALACGPPSTAVLVRQDDPSSSPATVYLIPIHGTIDLGLAPFVERSLGDARAAGAGAAILDIETPGGRVDAAERIVDAVQDAGLPVYAFANRRAFSAGAMIALSADRIFMHEGGMLGAATPVTGGGKKASEKIVSAMRAEMRALAERRGLDPAVAEAMVDEDIAIEGVDEPGKLLTLTTEEAARVGYATTVAGLDDVLAAAGAPGATVVTTEVNWAESLVRFFTHPAVAPLLLSLGFLGLLFELKTPAFGIAGTVGLVSLGLFFGSHWLVGLAGMEELLLLGGGLMLLVLEVFVVPGFGIAGVAGTTGVIAGLYLSLVGHLSSAADLTQAAGVLALSLLVVIVVAWALLRHLPRSGRAGKSGIMLEEATSRDTGYLSSAVRDELIGATGVALTDLRPAGAARIGEERVDVVAESNWIGAGTPVRVIRAEGYRHVVQPLD